MEKLIEITNKAVADYGFRQIVQWSPEDIVAQWQLSTREAEILSGVIKDELDFPTATNHANITRI